MISEQDQLHIIGQALYSMLQDTEGVCVVRGLRKFVVFRKGPRLVVHDGAGYGGGGAFLVMFSVFMFGTPSYLVSTNSLYSPGTKLTCCDNGCIDVTVVKDTMHRMLIQDKSGKKYQVYGANCYQTNSTTLEKVKHGMDQY